jgi:hypothetical protein
MISTINKRSFKLHFFNDFESMKIRIESNRNYQEIESISIRFLNDKKRIEPNHCET